METFEKVKWKQFILPVVIGLLIWFIAPVRPAGISIDAWHMLAIFIATIVACITQPMAIAGVTLIGFTMTFCLGLAPITDVMKDGKVIQRGALSAFSNSSAWLIVMAFMISRGIIKTGLGRRIALYFIKWFGKKSLGLGYAIGAIDLINSLANTFDSHPNDDSRKKMGAYLVFTEFQTNIITSSMFMTACAPNLIAVSLASKAGINLNWMGWLAASVVPAVICLLIVPYLVCKLFPPQVKETPNAKEWANEHLQEMGKMTAPEKVMALIFAVTLILWMLSSSIKLDATVVAFISLTLLLLFGILSPKDVLKETGAWNLLIWLSILVFMAGKLTQFGFIAWLSKEIEVSVKGMNWLLVLVILALILFYTHYLFASATAHNTAMYLPLLIVAVSAGAPKVLAAQFLAMFSAIMGSTTHYSSPASSVLSASGYVTQKEWWNLSFIFGLLYILVYGIIGLLWMKLIGMW
ncbi:DASS family sodium-coupled anion symporter [Lactobacillus mulieris]|uniref:DASS family sodium-coupled anion symporter n=1 Tax=Lactobacillus mulieris TaxID=2508708 RepID=UPI001432EE77|nr:DASS family sodium-coupled anion symporter [Lactobacillus mulieris]MDK6803389.1 DASS family sodium-coupled anion symporter [Lactobacillus mulieris]MDK8382489.1 DASS family sodium-coupled anion symporter [Lactobacillus mulieris]MDT9620908.1 DASS family sodium-coupled anion symporter [Lactobacillus mulieris]NKC41689.1 DASS family sodium-coupled anion symporter [Lactobacillus mulieris]